MLKGRKKLFYEWCQDSGIFDENQLSEIYIGLMNLSLEEVEVYSRECFDDGQMKQIRLGLEVLSMDEVMIYANEGFDNGQMWEIRQGLETLPVSDVMKYAKLEINRISMSSYRMNLQNKLFSRLFDIDPTFLIPSQVSEALRTVKRLPLDKALDIIDFTDNAREMEIKRLNAEVEYYGEMVRQHESNQRIKNYCDVICDMIDGLSSEELDRVVNYVNSKKCDKSFVKTKKI